MTSHLIAKNYGGDCDWLTERLRDLPQKKTMVESLIGSQNNHVTQIF